MNVTSLQSSFDANSVNCSRISSKRSRLKSDEVHLVDGDDEVRDAEQRHEQAVAPRLLDHAVAGVDQQRGEVGVRRAGDHVARVLDVPGLSAMMKLRLGVEK